MIVDVCGFTFTKLAGLYDTFLMVPCIRCDALIKPGKGIHSSGD